MRMLGSLLKQAVGGLEEVSKEVAQAYEDQKLAVGGQEPQLSDVVQMLQTSSLEKLMFLCIHALDECAVEYRVKLPNSLNQILYKSPGTRIFVTGRPHIRDEIEKRLFGGATALNITAWRGDVIRYLRSRLDEDTTSDAMDSSLEADILKKIPGGIQEIHVL